MYCLGLAENPYINLHRRLRYCKKQRIAVHLFSIILRCNYANELRTMDSLRGVVCFCLARPHLGSGRNFSSCYPLVPIFAIRSSFFYLFFLFIKIDFFFGAFAIPLFLVFSPPSCPFPSCFSSCPVLLDPFCFNLSERFWFRCFVLVSYPRSSIR